MGTITGTITDKKSSVDNINEKVDWVQKQIKEELRELASDVEVAKDKTKFYKKNGDTVEYDMDLVKAYLSRLNGLIEGKSSSEAWGYLKWRGKTAAWIMAVQIALESQWYDVDKIDGVFWDKTKKAVMDFQKRNQLNPDGLPGKDTISKLIDGFKWEDSGDNNWEAANQWENIDNNWWTGDNWGDGGSENSEEKELSDKEKVESVKGKTNVKIKVWDNLNVEDLVDNADWVNVSIDGPVDTTNPWNIRVNVKVKSWEEERTIGVEVTIIKENETENETENWTEAQVPAGDDKKEKENWRGASDK